MISRKLAVPIVAAVLAVGTFSTPAQAQRNNQTALGSLIAAIINVQAGDDILEVDLSNVLREADIRVLNNVLNNALNNNNIEVLSDIEVRDLINIGTIDIPVDVNVEDVTVIVNALGGLIVLLP